MRGFEDYRDNYSSIEMSRDSRGILEVRFHTEGGPLRWGHIGGPHSEFAAAFSDISLDPENRVVIMTGTGDSFSGPEASAETFPRSSAASWDTILRNGLRLTRSLLEIEAPVISCVNGPALRHPEIPLLADIVLACEEAEFQDSAHFPNRTVPGDGVNIFFPLLMGFNRGRHFLLTGRKLSSAEAFDLGLIAEIVERDKLLERARAIANQLADQSDLVLRYTRRMLVAPLMSMVDQHLGYGLALEGLAAVDETASGPYGEVR